jgi:hypothetical protein
VLDDNGSNTETTDEADALRRLRHRLRERQDSLYNEAHDLLDDHISAMCSLHPELNDAVGVLMDVFLGCEYEKMALRPTLRMLGFAAPGMAVRAAALYDVSLLLEWSGDVRRLRRPGLDSLEMELGLRESWMVLAKQRLAEAFGGPAQEAVRQAIADREERQRW